MAGRNARQTDATLTDCGLTLEGETQAKGIRQLLGGDDAVRAIQLVVSSPLTRALHTACLAFPDAPTLLCHYHLREIGSMIPENIPRPVHQVLQDLQLAGVPASVLAKIDTTTLQPDDWPRHHDTPPNVVRRDRIRQVLQWLAVTREETVIAVVCHYHVIRAAVQDPYAATTEIKPANACPIKCYLCPATGQLTLAST